MKKLIGKIFTPKLAYGVLTFIMGLCIVGASASALLRITVFNSSFLGDALNNSGYYYDLCNEITDDLKNIGDASGLDKEFFEGFVDEVLVREDIQSYIEKFYSGEELTVDTAHFNEDLRNALEKYEYAHGIDTTQYSEKNIGYFIKEAGKIYIKNIEINYLKAIQKGMLKYSKVFTILIAVLAAIIIGIVLLMFFTNKWKHVAVRYVYYGTASAGLFLTIVPCVIIFSGIIDKIAIISRSLNDLYVSCFKTVFNDMLIIGIVLMVIAAALAVVHYKLRCRAKL